MSLQIRMPSRRATTGRNQSLKELLLGNARSYGIFFRAGCGDHRIPDPHRRPPAQSEQRGRAVPAERLRAHRRDRYADGHRHPHRSVRRLGGRLVGGVGALAMKNWGLNWFLAIVR